MTIFISGGCKNGKSFHAQRIAQYLSKQDSNGGLFYLATMRPYDNEDDDRILRHQKERDGWGFTTIEQPENILQCLKHGKAEGTYLLDSTTALLANEMFTPDGMHPEIYKKIACEVKELCTSVNNIVIVSDTIYCDAAQYDEWTESYRKGLAFIDCTLADTCDVVIEVAFGNVIYHKGQKEAAQFYEALI